MRADKCTEKVQEALQNAARTAQGRGQQGIEPEHLLLALVRERDGISRPLLEAAGVSSEGLATALASELERLPRVSGGQPFVSTALNLVLEQAEREAGAL